MVLLAFVACFAGTGISEIIDSPFRANPAAPKCAHPIREMGGFRGMILKRIVLMAYRQACRSPWMVNSTADEQPDVLAKQM